MADLRFFLSNHNDEKQSETKVEYETVERIDKTITLIDYREQKDKFIEGEIRKRVMIDVTPKMKELLTKIDNLTKLDYFCGEDDDMLELAMKFTSQLRDEVAQNMCL